MLFPRRRLVVEEPARIGGTGQIPQPRPVTGTEQEGIGRAFGPQPAHALRVEPDVMRGGTRCHVQEAVRGVPDPSTPAHRAEVAEPAKPAPAFAQILEPRVPARDRLAQEAVVERGRILDVRGAVKVGGGIIRIDAADHGQRVAAESTHIDAALAAGADVAEPGNKGLVDHAPDVGRCQLADRALHVGAVASIRS